MIVATQNYLEEWNFALLETDSEDEYLGEGDLTSMGHFWLEHDYHPALGCTEDQVRRILGATFSGDRTGDAVGLYFVMTMVADVESMQVIGYEPGLGFYLTYHREIIRTMADGEVSRDPPLVDYLLLDPDLEEAFGPFFSCP